MKPRIGARVRVDYDKRDDWRDPKEPATVFGTVASVGPPGMFIDYSCGEATYVEIAPDGDPDGDGENWWFRLDKVKVTTLKEKE